MSLYFWSILLIAFAAQNLFLAAVLLIRPLSNKKANGWLLFLLAIILCTLVSNGWTASFLYRKMLFPAMFTRGMVLLLGPIVYLYVSSVITPSFRFKRSDWLHFLPYTLNLVINLVRLKGMTTGQVVTSIDEFVGGEPKVSWLSLSQFVLYSLHILAYLAVIHFKIRQIVDRSKDPYIIPLTQRVTWLKNISKLLLSIAVLFASISIYIIFKGTYGIRGNIIYTISLALLVYAISYQAIRNNYLLAPGFEKKYRSQKLDAGAKETILSNILHLLKHEKIFTNPDLNIRMMAERASSQPHIISQLVNEQLNKSFTELLHEYRIEEFKKRVVDPGNRKFSINGLANEVGYSSKSAFHKAFKKDTGQTPAEYIKGLGGQQTGLKQNVS